MKKRILSALLCAIMVISMIPFDAFAAGEVWNEIYTVEDLYNVRYDMSANYKLMNDIDLTEATAPGGDYDFMGNGWNPIGSNDDYGESGFTGVFDGCGYKIIGMRIDTSSFLSNEYDRKWTTIGLFASIRGLVRNLNVVDVDFVLKRKKDYNTASTRAGIIAANNYGTIEDCSVSGSVFIENKCDFGSIVKDNNRLIQRCFSDVKIVDNGDYWTSIGGFFLYNMGTVNDCFLTGSLIGDYFEAFYGGLTSGSGSATIVNNCYSTIILNGDGRPFSTGDKNTNCYYPQNCPGATVNGATSLTDAQMRQQASFAGFDFENTWVIYPDSAYPYPQLRSNPIDPENAVDRLEITQMPGKLTYLEGDNSLNPSGGKLTVHYKDGSTLVKSFTRDMLSGFDSTKVGTQSVTVTFGRNTTTYDVTVIPKSLSGISVAELPAKTDYLEGYDSLDLAGGKLDLIYDNGDVEQTDLSNAQVTGFDNTAVGTQTLTAEFHGFTAQFDVNIVPKTAVSIEMATLPSKLDYVEARDAFDPAGARILVKYDNGSVEYVDLTKSMVSGFDNSRVAKLNLTVSYSGLVTSFAVNIIEKSVSRISVSTLPNKLNYIEGLENLSLTGGKISVVYNNGTTAVLNMTESMVSGFDNSAVGTKTLTVTYKGASATFDVNIIEKSVTGIEIVKNPAKLVYLEGKDQLDVTGGRIRINYNNGTSDETDLSAATVTGFDNTVPGAKRLTVTYLGKTTTFDVEIAAKKPVSVRMNDLPAKLSYLEGKDALSVLGGRLRVDYDNQTYSIVDLTADMVSGFDNSRVGKWSLTVSYLDFKTRYEIEIVPKSVYAVSVASLPAKTSYAEKREALDLTGAKLTLRYDNGDVADVDITPDMVSGFDNTAVGSCEITVTYEGHTDFFAVEIVHDYEKHEHAPTCTEAGYTEYVCAQCGDTYREPGESARHKPGEWIVTKDPSCTEKGSRKTVCTVCGKTVAEEDIPALGHSFGEWNVTLQPTESESGKMERVCGRCHEKEERIVPPIGERSCFVADSVKITRGKEFTLNVRVTNNPGIIAAKLEIGYDPQVLELIEAIPGEFSDLSFGPTDQNPLTVIWDDSLNPNNTTNGVFVSLRFKAKDGIEPQTTAVTVAYEAENVFNSSYENVAFDAVNGAVTVTALEAGDANADGKVNLKDYAALKQNLNGWDVEVEKSVCDVNADGKVNLKDLALLRQFINGWDVVLK